MFVIDWRLALVSLAVMPMIAIASMAFQRWMRTTYRQQRVRLARVNAFLQENLAGMLVVQLFNREKRQFNALNDLNKDYLRANLDSLKAMALFYPVVKFLSAVSIGLLLWYGSGSILS